MKYPVIPPRELVAMWAGFSARHHSAGSVDYVLDLATKAAQWGADQELEACCEWIPKATPWDAEQLRAARRPKPPSLKEQALDDLHIAFDTGCFSERQADTIRRALEQLPDDK